MIYLTNKAFLLLQVPMLLLRLCKTENINLMSHDNTTVNAEQGALTHLDIPLLSMEQTLSEKCFKCN